LLPTGVFDHRPSGPGENLAVQHQSIGPARGDRLQEIYVLVS
jgi:hypothetical protein